MSIVFIGMETSGVLRRRFQALGYETYSCDMLPSEDGGEEPVYSTDGKYLGRHLVGDVFQCLENMDANDLWPELAIFHPDCTYLTNSAAWAYGDGPYHQRVKPETLVGAARREAREIALQTVRNCMKLPIRRKAIENPIGTISTAIRAADQIVQPYNHGDDASKATCFWYTNADGKSIRSEMLLPEVTNYVKPRLVCYNPVTPPQPVRCGHVSPYGTTRCPRCGGENFQPRWANQTDSGQNRLSPGADRWKNRARTYPGIADTLVAKCHELLQKDAAR
jgi:hypothetical protein